MYQRKKSEGESSLIERMIAAEEEVQGRVVLPVDRQQHDSVGASTAPDVMRHISGGAGAATGRSGKGGKSGGGMGGQQAGGMKGGGKRKTHAGRK